MEYDNSKIDVVERIGIRKLDKDLSCIFNGMTVVCCLCRGTDGHVLIIK